MKPINIPSMIVALVITCLAMACGGVPPKQLTKEASWNLVGWSDKGKITMDLEHLPTIGFTKGGQVSGNGGVNGFDGEFKAKVNGEIHLGPLEGTEMGGPREILAMEQTYFRLLSKVTRWSIVDDTLILSDRAGHNQLRYKAKSGKADRELKGQPWKLHGLEVIHEGGITFTAFKEVCITFKISNDDGITGHGGVNRYTARADIKGDKRIMIAKLVSTKKAGNPENMAAERRYFDKLGAVTHWEIRGSQLILADEKKSFGLVFEAYDEPG